MDWYKRAIITGLLSIVQRWECVAYLGCLHNGTWCLKEPCLRLFQGWSRAQYLRVGYRSYWITANSTVLFKITWYSSFHLTWWKHAIRLFLLNSVTVTSFTDFTPMFAEVLVRCFAINTWGEPCWVNIVEHILWVACVVSCYITGILIRSLTEII